MSSSIPLPDEKSFPLFGENVPRAEQVRCRQTSLRDAAPTACVAPGFFKPKGYEKKLMWNPKTPGSGNATPATPEPVRPAAPASTPLYEQPATRTASPAAAAAAGEQATIGKSLMIKGEVTGSESLYIDGRIEGTITLPGNRVTVGRNGQVAANISAREIVVLGKVRGNCQASDRIDIRSEGSLTGDVTAARISIEDGAFFKGGHRHPQARRSQGRRGNTPARSGGVGFVRTILARNSKRASATAAALLLAGIVVQVCWAHRLCWVHRPPVSLRFFTPRLRGFFIPVCPNFLKAICLSSTPIYLDFLSYTPLCGLPCTYLSEPSYTLSFRPKRRLLVA